MPSEVKRNAYLITFATTTGMDRAVLQREVDKLIASGKAIGVAQGTNATAPPDPILEAEEGWWNRDRGEGEALWDFFYRRYCRLRIANHLVAWHLLEEWAQLTDDIMQSGEATLFEAEWQAWQKIRDGVTSDPVWREMHGEQLTGDPCDLREERSVDLWEELLARISLLVPDEKLGPIIDRAEDVAQGHKYVKGQEWMVDAIEERLDQIWDERTSGITAALVPES